MSQKPQAVRIREYMESEYGTPPEYLWRGYPSFFVCRNANNRKWYALVMRITCAQLGLATNREEDIDVINLHLNPSMVEMILPRDAFMPGYHMNKASWVSIPLNDRLKDREIFPLIDASYESVMPRKKK